ncbi:MAG: hypothetical protein KAJ65_00995 [Gammaproteobacteria bacterium]|nr:hypothetical protein [Gammaproteobacteria bacterium]
MAGQGGGLAVRNLYVVVFKHGIMMVFLLTAATVQAEWSVRDTATSCVLETEEITLHDGYQDTRVRLNINNERLLVVTGSNIDTGFDDTALQVDGQAVIPADAAEDEQNLRFDAHMPTIIEQFRKGNRVRVYLRFWPTYPATQRYEAAFSLAGFTRAWNDYSACRDRISQ